MKISCFKYDLLAGINIALRAVPVRTTLPILECLLIDACEDKITISANDNDMAIECAVNGSIEMPGKIAIDARIFSEIVRKLPENIIFIETDPNHKMKIKCETSEFNLSGHNGDEFPEFPQFSESNKVGLSQFTLKELIRTTIFSIAPNDNNSIMRGELFEVENGKIKVVSLDGHRISIRTEQLGEDTDPFKVIVPGKTLNEICRVLTGEKNDSVEIDFDKKFIKFSFSNTMVVSRLIDGEYFNVNKMISSDYETAVKINRSALLDEVERAYTLTRESERKPIVMEIKEGDMFLELTSSIGSMYGRVDIRKEGKDQIIGFNPKFFIDVLKAVDDEKIDIYFVNSNSPCFICNEIGNYIYIILPVNINR